MINFGRVRPGSTLEVYFESFASSTGAPITITGLATSDILVYKDGGTTQRASAAGFTLLDTDGIDFDGITGIHGFSIDLSDNTTADFWAAGSRYTVVVSTITVDSQTMSFIAATFRIGYEPAILDTTIATLSSQTSFTLTSGPAEDDALNGREVIIHDAASAVQLATGLILDYTGSTKTVTLAAAPTFTIAAKDNISVMALAPLQPATLGRTVIVDSAGAANANLVQILGTTLTETAGQIAAAFKKFFNVATPTGTLNSIPDAIAGAAGGLFIAGTNAATTVTTSFTTTFTGNLTGSVASVSGTVGGIAGTTQTLDALQTALNSAHGAGSWATATGFSTHSAADVWGVATRVLTAGTNIALAKGTGVTGFNDLDADGVRTAVGLASADIDTQLGLIYGAIDTEVGTAVSQTTAAAIRSALGLGSANLDTQLDALPTNAELATALGTADDATLAAIAALSIPTAAQNAAALMDLSNGIETSITPRQALRLILAASAGKLSGAATTTITIRNVGDSKDRITATVDADGNRSAVTTDAT